MKGKYDGRRCEVSENLNLIAVWVPHPGHPQWFKVVLSEPSIKILDDLPKGCSLLVRKRLLANLGAAAGLSIGFMISVRVLRQLVSLPFTLFEQRLNFRLRWYIVTDRSLRIRSGIWSTQELTTTFANIQEIRISSGPLQKLLGLADVEVHSAGGGAGKQGEAGGHVARFEGVDIANEIRDLIGDRLRQYRDAGLGESERVAHAAANGDAIAAANGVLEEARALRVAVQKRY